MGTGTHLHNLILAWIGRDYSPGCSCRDTVKAMDANPPQWSRDNLRMIVDKIKAEATKQSWMYRRILRHIPGCNAPIKWLVKEAIRLAEQDLERNQ